MGINKNGTMSVNTSNYNYIINNFSESGNVYDWSTGGALTNRKLVLTGKAPQFESTTFDVGSDDILVFELTISLPTPSTTTAGPGIYVGITNGAETHLHYYNAATRAWVAGTTTNTNPYFHSNGINTASVTQFKSYILGKNVDIKSVPPTECNDPNRRIYAIQLLNDNYAKIRTGYNTNTDMVIHVANPRLYNLKQNNFIEGKTVSGIGKGYANANTFYEF